MRKFLLGLALLVPTAASAQTTVTQSAVPTVSAGASTGVVLATGAKQVASIDIVAGTSGGFAVLYDSATIPPDAALNPALIRWCLPIGGNVGISDAFRAPRQFYYGVTAFVSTSSCTTKAATGNAFVSVQIP